MHDERLDVESLHLWRGDRHVLRGVCFSLASGECLQVTGPNGSGKTSLLRTVCGLMYPEAGRVLRSEEHTSELQSQSNLVCRLLLEKKKKTTTYLHTDESDNYVDGQVL